MFSSWLDCDYGVQEEDYRGKGRFSSCYIKGTYYHCGLSLLILTLITWLRSCLSGFFTVKFLFPPTLHSLQHTLKEGGVLLTPSLRAKYLHKLFGILLPRKFVSPSPFIYLFNPLFISVWAHGYLFYILDYNNMLHYLFGCSIFFSVLANGSSFGLAPVSL